MYTRKQVNNLESQYISVSNQLSSHLKIKINIMTIVSMSPKNLSFPIFLQCSQPEMVPSAALGVGLVL